VLNFVTELDKPALLLSALFLGLYLIRKNKFAFLIIAELMILSNWYLYIPDSIATSMVYDCFTVIFSGFLVYLMRSNFILVCAQSYFLLFNISSYIINTLYYKYETLTLYKMSLFMYDGYILYNFVPFIIITAIGCLVKGSSNGGRRVNSSNSIIHNHDYLYDVHSTGSFHGYYEKRF
jgi:hypothetical protein